MIIEKNRCSKVGCLGLPYQSMINLSNLRLASSECVRTKGNQEHFKILLFHFWHFIWSFSGDISESLKKMSSLLYFSPLTKTAENKQVKIPQVSALTSGLSIKVTVHIAENLGQCHLNLKSSLKFPSKALRGHTLDWFPFMFITIVGHIPYFFLP